MRILEGRVLHLKGLPAFLPCVFLGLTGCHPWYWVESEYQGATLRNAPPEIAETAAYRRVVQPGVSIALSAPDECADLSVAQATGHSKPAGQLLATTCGVLMAELERSLLQAGFRVIAWNAVRQMVLYEENVTPLEAAQKLDAAILLQVNSLERSTVQAGHEIRWERRFYDWDLNFFQWIFGVGANGSKGEAAVVAEERARALEEGMHALEEKALPREQISVAMNATAILAKTGEAVWFYSWAHSEDVHDEVRTAQLFECHRRHLFRCLPRRWSPPDVSAPPPRSGSKGHVTTPPQAANPADAVYYQLARELIDDLVSRFRTRSF